MYMYVRATEYETRRKEKGPTLPCRLFGLTGVAMANNNGKTKINHARNTSKRRGKMEQRIRSGSLLRPAQRECQPKLG